MLTDRKTTKIVELKMETGLLETVQNVALTRFNARINHKSGKPEVTSTLNYLIRKGIESLDRDNQDSNRDNTVNYPDNLVTQDDLKNALSELPIPIESLINKDDFESAIAALRSELMGEIETLKELEPAD